MEIIPVIDVRGGVAVAAVRGDRARYRPLETPLAESADPVAVVRGLSALFPFTTLYVADLDGIEGRGADLATQRRLAESWPGSEVWIDDGGTTSEIADREPRARQVPSPWWGGPGWGDSQRPQRSVSRVLGSESLTSLEDYAEARDIAGPSALLSLDFRGDRFLGPPGLLDDPALWPDRVIVMTLARVGSGEGPDLERLASVIERAEERSVYAAGGVRDVSDLDALCGIGAAGALVATALHAGRIGAADIERIAARA